MLRHAFEATSINKLAEKIIQGRYAPVSARYSRDIRELLGSLLGVAPRMRPSAAAILQLPIIRQRLGRLVAHRDSSSRRSTAQVYQLANPPPKAPPLMICEAPSQSANGSEGECKLLARRSASNPQPQSAAEQRQPAPQGKGPPVSGPHKQSTAEPLLRFRDILAPWHPLEVPKSCLWALSHLSRLQEQQDYSTPQQWRDCAGRARILQGALQPIDTPWCAPYRQQFASPVFSGAAKTGQRTICSAGKGGRSRGNAEETGTGPSQGAEPQR
ncbi:hypothetical protein WJX75_005710 [Coccomyxa subellipsoidea]|uniref:non-specific serine/threonine protein kinase n=1 Tax=Coccomyxa subellipsoidea TaxID=248742 RepID=A0ABR2YX33_9CHLO